MIGLTINGEKREFPEGKTILECLETAGIKVPTLCYYKALLPYGACRLCLVEVSQDGRPSSIQTSCTYPAINGLIVKTDTERVIKTRKIMAELLLARCPDVQQIKDLAKELGVEKMRIKSKNKDCTLCGLCVRICEERMGPAAVGFSGRGPRREVKPPFGVPSDVCQTCGACAFICPTGRIKLTEVSRREPIPIPFEHNMGLDTRPPVYIPYPQAVPNKAAIDDRYCVYLLRGKCGICKEFCEAEAITYEQKEEKIDLDTGAIILSPGYEVFDARLKSEYGYGHYPNVLTALEFERILSASGPFGGKVIRPYDKAVPKRIAWIQCVGSRDSERDYCSSVCCMYATKEAIIAKEHMADLQCDIFFMDLRAFGKGFDEYYERAKGLGINYIRSRPSNIEENPETKNLLIYYLSNDGERLSGEYDLVVLSTGMIAPKSAREFEERVKIKLNSSNFCQTGEFDPVNTEREGIFSSGTFTEPKDIPETVMQGSAAASKALELLSDARFSLVKPKEYPPEIDVSGQEPRIGVFVCHCGTNIAGVVNVPEVVEYAKALANVVYAEDNLYTCSTDTQKRIREIIKEKNLNRVIVASCSPRTHEPLFRNTIREAGLNSYLFEMANIRDQCSWVHMHEPLEATKKAKDLVRMAAAKSRLLEPLYTRKVPVDKNALVIGGGISGLVTSLGLANQGFRVHLVEKEKELGGNFKKLHYLLSDNGDTPKQYLDQLIGQVKGNNRISIYTDTKLQSVEGFIGNFKTKIGPIRGEASNGVNENTVNHGIVIVATGGQEYRPKEYHYGENPEIMTQLELEEKLANPQSAIRNSKSIVMIQCVGSRDEERPYCSRICCSEAIKNALKIKEMNKDINVFIIYRDVRAYGFKEKYYTKAREKGVIFIRYEKDRKPDVQLNNGSISVGVYDPILENNLLIQPDLLVLSAGIVPNQDREEIAQMLKIPLNQNGFFLEAHMKLRPIDFATEGVFLAGLGHSPKTTSESIIQALGAAGRAGTILSKDTLELDACISQVIDEYCDGCAYCIDPCPYKAITLIEYMKEGAIKKTVEVDETACKGCGTCQATCPKKGIFVRGFKLEQIAAQVSAALEG